MNKLKEFREKRKVSFSQYHLAALSGVPQNRISLIERGLAKASQKEMKKITEALNVKLQDVFPVRTGEKVLPVDVLKGNWA